MNTLKILRITNRFLLEVVLEILLVIRMEQSNRINPLCIR